MTLSIVLFYKCLELVEDIIETGFINLGKKWPRRCNAHRRTFSATTETLAPHHWHIELCACNHRFELADQFDTAALSVTLLSAWTTSLSLIQTTRRTGRDMSVGFQQGHDGIALLRPELTPARE